MGLQLRLKTKNFNRQKVFKKYTCRAAKNNCAKKLSHNKIIWLIWCSKIYVSKHFSYFYRKQPIQKFNKRTYVSFQQN